VEEEVNASLTNVHSYVGLNKQVLDQLNIEISTLSQGLSELGPNAEEVSSLHKQSSQSFAPILSSGQNYSHTSATEPSVYKLANSKSQFKLNEIIDNFEQESIIKEQVKKKVVNRV